MSQIARQLPASPSPEATLFKLLIASTVLLQRFAIPFAGGQVPLVLPVVCILVLLGISRGVLEEHALRLQLYLTAVIACLVSTIITVWRGLSWSPLSIGYLVVTYAPFVFRTRRFSADAYREGLSFFLKLMTGAAVLGLVQFGAQLLGWAYRDPLGILPSGWVLQGFNTTYSATYGSSMVKSNGFLFLEPSFYSQFLALAVIIHLYLRRRGLSLYVCATALVASLSGTGVLLAGAGVCTLWFERSKRDVKGPLIMAAIAVAVALSPIGNIYSDRIARSSSSDTSARGRFVVPYQLASSRLANDPAALLTGQGPGSAQRLSRQFEETTGITAVFPVIPKLAFEYGLPSSFIFMIFILVVALRGTPSVAITLSVLVMYLTLSGSLLQPATVYLLFALTSLFSIDDEGRRGAEAETDRGRVSERPALSPQSKRASPTAPPARTRTE